MATRKKIPLTRTALATVSILALSAVAYGCSSGVSQSEADRQAADAAAEAAAEAEAAAAAAEAERMAAVQAALTAIAEAATIEAAQAAYAAVDQATVTAAEDAELQAALASRVAALTPPPPPLEIAMPAELPEGFEAVPGTYSFAAGDYVVAGGVWIACGDIGPDCTVTIHADGTATASPDSGAVYIGITNQAQAALDERDAAAEREAEQRMALAAAAAAVDTSDDTLSTQEGVDAARTAIADLRQAIENAADVSDADKAMYMSTLDDAVAAVGAAQDGIDLAAARMEQMDALSDASDDLQAALAALAGQTPTQEQIDAASAALTALNAAITGAEDLTDAETATYEREAENAAAPIETAQMSLDDAEEEAAEDARMEAAEAMAATAAKLIAGISAPSGETTSTDIGTRAAAYNGDDIDVRIVLDANGDGTADTPIDATLSLDEDAMVAALDGWEGMMFTAEPDGGGTYEAVVYSNVGEPTEGLKFGHADAATDEDYAYALNAEGEHALTTGDAGTTTEAELDVQARVASPSFDQSAGTKEFEKGNNLERVIIAGSYHGVSGTYNCTPTTDQTCSATVAAMGFALGGGTWTFTPADPETRLMETPDADYASYGWWLHTAEDGTLTASAFHANHGAARVDLAIADLRGTARYVGGAAGKYALSSSTGGTNDAGHFTARVELEATFAADHMISGTIDNFMGADGMSRDWSVGLNETDISDTGVIDGTNDANEQVGTVWTIDGVDADASGQWSGNLQEAEGGVPQVATGTFYSTYGTAGKMVGAFGANQE